MYWAERLNTLIRKEFPVLRLLKDGSLSPIQPTIFGIRIDFESVVAISNAQHIDRMGDGGHFLAFSIFFKEFIPNSDRSHLHYEWEANVKYDNGKQEYLIDEGLKELQIIIDFYVDIWEKIKIQGRTNA